MIDTHTQKDSTNKHYVYCLIDPDTNTPFYIGKGSNDRCSWHVECVKKGTSSGNKYKDNQIKKILKENKEPIVEIIKYFEDEDTAYKFEEEQILHYGRRINKTGCLCNITADSRPPNHTGKKRSLTTKIKQSQAKIGNKNHMFGKAHTAESKNKISKKTSGVNNYFYDKTGESHPVTGFKHSAEECARRSERARQLMSTPEMKQKASTSLTARLSKTWNITDPAGNNIIVTNLNKFCKERNIPWYKIRTSLDGWICKEYKHV